MYVMTSQAKEKVSSYIADGILEKDLAVSLFRANDKKQILKAFQKELRINELNHSKVWNHIVQNIWVKQEDIFSKHEILLLKEIINHNGAILFSTAKSDVLKSEYLAYKTLKTFIDKKIVEIIELRQDRIIILHPKMLKTEIFV